MHTPAYDAFLAAETAVNWLYFALALVGVFIGWKVFNLAVKWLIRGIVIVVLLAVVYLAWLNWGAI